MLYVVSGYDAKVTSRFKYRYHIIILSLCLSQVSDDKSIFNRKKNKKEKKKNTILNTKQKTYIRDQKRFVLNDD